VSGDTIRLTGKAVLEWALSLGAARTLRHHAARGASRVLAYHNVVPAESRKGGDVSLHLAFDTFRRQLDYLGRHTSVVSLADVLGESPAAMPETDRPRVAITFDDAYADAMQIALPELASRGMPATVFVAPALLGVDCTWWDRYLGPAQHESDERRAHALDALARQGVAAPW
jgi:peptidoglycan/xylan/chitin deacetylase (PgdA/CDA1 family)